MLEKEKVRAMLQKVRAIELRTRMASSDVLSGLYHSKFKGQGMVFSEIREYVPGDEIRLIDWKSSAKLGKPYIKIFEEDRELTLVIAIDISRSMACGSIQQSKREFATEIASVLALSALKNNDKVGLFLFSNNTEKFVPPQKGHQHLLRVIREALFFQPQHEKTDLVTCLRILQQTLKKKAIICLLSDFLPTVSINTDLLKKTLSFIAQKHDLLCIQIEDPREMNLPDVGFVALEDAETKQCVYINTHDEKVRKIYTVDQENQRYEFQILCNRNGIDVLTLINGQPYLTNLQVFFQSRFI